MRWLWRTAGLGFVGVGFLGMALPLLPATPFFLLAAWCFARSDERLMRWLLDLPTVGPLIQDYHAGRGIPRRAKRIAIAMIVVSVGASALWGARSLPVKAAVVALGTVGILYLLTRVPTRENVLTTTP